MPLFHMKCKKRRTILKTYHKTDSKKLRETKFLNFNHAKLYNEVTQISGNVNSAHVHSSASAR